MTGCLVPESEKKTPADARNYCIPELLAMIGLK